MQRPLSRDEVVKIRTEVFFDFNQPGQLSPIYKAALQPIEVYAPLDAYYKLYDTLKIIAEDGFEDDVYETAIGLYEDLKRHFLSNRRTYAPNLEKNYLWARVLIILTMEIFVKAIGQGEPVEIRQAYLPAPGEQSAVDILDDIQRLYDLAKTMPAGGAAFHFTASILLLSKSLADQSMNEVKFQSLDRYLDLTRRLNRRNSNDITYETFQKLAPEHDHCIAYLRDKYLERIAPPLRNESRILPYNFNYPGNSKKTKASWLRWRKKSGEDTRDMPEKNGKKTIIAVMIGPSGSGKTTLVRQLVKANQQAVELGVGLQIMYGPSDEGHLRVLEQAPPPGTQHMLQLQGVLSPLEAHGHQPAPATGQSNEAARPILNIFDSKGGSMFVDPPPLGGASEATAVEQAKLLEDMSEGEKLYHVTAQADLLVLCIPPESLIQSAYTAALGRGALDIYFSNFVARVSQGNKNAMLAIAYTKCDEYGVQLSPKRRIIEEEAVQSALDMYRDAEVPRNAAWQIFLKAASRRGAGGESKLVNSLLTSTEALWKTTVRNSRHRFLNGYLVSADPALNYLGNGSSTVSRDWESLGLLQIFADLFAHLKATQVI
jgi:energy-coupling factor transporter ATP-binding protein EcfA2